MVTTRSGEVRRYGVRFRRGPAVRRILEFNDEEEVDGMLGSNQTNINKAAPNGGILVNGTHSKTPAGSNDSASGGYELSAEQNELGNTTIFYSIDNEERRYLGSAACDTVLFTLIILSSYLMASLIYFCCGYVLYMIMAVLCIIMFSYNITYFDSSKPGVMPPSPVSPALYRQISGHTYHLSYVMSVINGLIFLLVEPYILNMVVPQV